MRCPTSTWPTVAWGEPQICLTTLTPLMRAGTSAVTFVLQFVLLLTLGPAAASAAPPFADASREVYKQVGAVTLAIHIFSPEGHRPSDERPAALFFFGGGWTGGNVKQFVPHCRYLAQRGMVGMVADYRVKSRHNTSPVECVKDAKSAVRWLRSHAGRLGIAPNRLAVGGGSAGGHLAAATATIAGLNEEGEDTTVSALPNALLLFNPVYDNGPGSYGYERVKDYYREISPYHNIRQGMPPTIVFLGTEDKLVPVATAQRFQQKMRDVGSRSELFLFDGQQHGFFNHTYFQPKREGLQYYQATMREIDQFLVSLEYLPEL